MKTVIVILACLVLSGCGAGMASLIPSSDVCPNGIDSVTGQCR
ncbi:MULTISPECIES: hypothetical protein [Erwinia]|jgi:uncharacterized protein YceK|nr:MULTISPECIES: hypothetical protein [Erwinia]